MAAQSQGKALTLLDTSEVQLDGAASVASFSASGFSGAFGVVAVDAAGAAA
ncbi:hypothetical protein [Enterobacter ludwigii]|uniref:hypothetical protein n=1 Tax=Enterobacter ludwigii TaxID=299767 RepID=UPI000A60C430|nr:hypothetical protein [Enterobacter ludwigii]